jgi:hypothetical protein
MPAELVQQFGSAGLMIGMLIGALRWLAGRWDRDRERAEARWERTTDQLTGILRENTTAQV